MLLCPRRTVATLLALGEDEFFFFGMFVGVDGVAALQFTAQDALADTVFDVVLDGAFERAGSELYVVALRGYKLLGSVADGQVIAHVLYPLEEPFELDVDDALDGVEVELVEGDDFVEAVEELRGELSAKALLDDGAGVFLVFLVEHATELSSGVEADAASELFELSGAGVGGHDDDGVAEVDESPVAVGQSSFVEHLQ